jgi:hypothetical protein
MENNTDTTDTDTDHDHTESYHDCPICNENFDVNNLFFHVMYSHPEFLAVWLSLTNPSRTAYVPSNEINANINNIWTYYSVPLSSNILANINLNTFETSNYNYLYNSSGQNMFGHYLFDFNDEYDDNNTEGNYDDYEYLLSICERIGYHKVGVKDINISVPLISEEEMISNKIDLTNSCPICLEELQTNYYLRKITKCGHIYCSYCIETWLKDNKTCPICKQDAEEI